MALQSARSASSALRRRLLSSVGGSIAASHSSLAQGPGASGGILQEGCESAVARRSFCSEGEKVITATLFPGDGIGPEIATSVKEVALTTVLSSS